MPFRGASGVPADIRPTKTRNHPTPMKCAVVLVLGRPIAAFPLVVAMSCPSLKRVFMASEDSHLQALGRSLGVTVIEPGLSSSSLVARVVALVKVLGDLLAREGQSLDLLVVFFAHAASISPEAVEQGMAAMKANATFDSALSVSSWDHWLPKHALRLESDGAAVPYLSDGRPADIHFDDAATSGHGAWFSDLGVLVVRPAVVAQGQWLGRRTYAIRQAGAMALEVPWQVTAIEAWVQSHGIDRLFRVRRTLWSQFYDSERAILSLMQLNNHAAVLDIGSDPGGLGLALLARFGTRDYTALVAEADKGGEVSAIYPDAKILVGQIESQPPLRIDGFDLVSALDISDSPHFFDQILPAAFRQLMECGSLIFSARLSDGASVHDAQISSQEVLAGRGVKIRRGYVVSNTADILAAVIKLRPAKITAYGYVGKPAATATTPLTEVCFSVFAVTRGVENGPAVPSVDLQLPAPYAG